ncbi:hypothetical protein [Mesoterricola silvestris]|uniref:Uncharacterized protein n=1 Tax=Mesoterricola silvestris TaxID=2927979 RepID=A0AA48K8H4_9BACT|nr:hypothetical protein [Mesoterricola silvestris]BDU71332.1 hypothetical protein METEAL_05060 [Mesoterricola silvestris]
MNPIHYNDMIFTVEKRGGGWDILCTRAGGATAVAAAGLFPGAPEEEAAARALRVIRTVFPVGVRCVGPDVAHPNRIGDLKIVGPDVLHPNFIHWDADSVTPRS